MSEPFNVNQYGLNAGMATSGEAWLEFICLQNGSCSRILRQRAAANVPSPGNRLRVWCASPGCLAETLPTRTSRRWTSARLSF